MMFDTPVPLTGARAPQPSTRTPTSTTRDRRVRPGEDDPEDTPVAESGDAPVDTPAASAADASTVSGAAVAADVAPDVGTAPSEALPATVTPGEERHDDRSSVLLAAGLGLLGIGGAASIAGSSSSSSTPPITAAVPPTPGQPRPDSPVSGQKPDTGSSKPTGPDHPGADLPKPDQPDTDQPKPDQPKPDQPNPDQPQHPDPGKSDPDPTTPADPDPKPAAHAPAAPLLSLAEDTGSSDHDRITSSGAVKVSGLEAGATLAVSLDDGKTWTQRGGDALLPESLFGADGAKHLEVRQIDAAGNEGVVAELSFELDRTAPDAPHWTMPAGKPALGAADVIALQGVETDARVDYRLDANSPWQTAAGGLVPVAVLHAEGLGQVDVRQTDLAGNVSSTATVSAQVDLTAPAAPTLSLDDDTGVSPTDGLTSSGKVRVGQIEPGATLQVAFGDRFVDTVLGTDGRLDLFSNVTTNGNPIQLHVRQVDVAGNAGPAAELDFTLDNRAPDATVSSSSQHAYWQGDLRIVPRTPTTLDAGDVVVLNAYDDIEVSPDASAGPVTYRVDDGQWMRLPDDHRVPLGAFGRDGEHTVEIRQVDLAGNIGSQKVAVDVDTTPPSTPTLALFNDNGAHTTDRITSDGRVMISGAGLAGLDFETRVNGGNWVSERLGSDDPRSYVNSDYEGSVTVEARFIDAAGNVSAIGVLNFTQTHAPI